MCVGAHTCCCSRFLTGKKLNCANFNFFAREQWFTDELIAVFVRRAAGKVQPLTNSSSIAKRRTLAPTLDRCRWQRFFYRKVLSACPLLKQAATNAYVGVTLAWTSTLRRDLLRSRASNCFGTFLSYGWSYSFLFVRCFCLTSKSILMNL